MSAEIENEDAEGGENTAPVEIGKRRFNMRLLFGIVLTVTIAGVINAPYQYTVLTAQGDVPTDDFDMELEDGIHGAVTEAGWPLRYLVQHEFENTTDSKQWFFGAAFINLAITLSLFGLAYWYLGRNAKSRSLRGVSKTEKPKRASLSLSDLLVLVGLIALPMGYWKHQEHLFSVQEQIAQSISTNATVKFRAITPTILSKRAPRELLKTWRRITHVDLHEPSQEDLEVVCRLSHLRSLRIGGGQYDLTPLRRLPSMRYLVDLRIAGRPIDATTVQAIAACPLVSHLNVARTNCTPDAMRQFATMPRLRRLMAFGCDVPYDAWESTPLKQILVELHIDRPDTGQAGKVVFHQWPQLEQLFLQSRDQFANRSVFDVTISEMPKLNFLEVDPFQLHDLTLVGLPKLDKISAIRRNTFRRVADGERGPISLWLRRGKLAELPLMEKLVFDPQSFESIRIGDCEKLSKVLASSYSQMGSEDSEYDLTHEKIHRQNLIDSLAKMSGPSAVGLFGLRLDDLDLTPLNANKDLNSIGLGESIVSLENIQQLAQLKTIEYLDFSESKIDQKVVGRINKLFPNLISLTVPTESTAIRMEDKSELETLSIPHYTNQSPISALRLINVPKLTSPMIVSEMGHYCVVKNAPKMTGLAILRPIPTTEISQVESLTWFVAGGETLRDEVVSEVLKAKDLTSLTLAYPSASKAAFAGLTQLRQLQSLEVPAAPLDDDQMQAWEIPQSLTTLNLDDCQLTETTVDRILERGNWVTLSLKGNAIAESSLPKLSKSQMLFHLGLGAVPVTKNLIDKLPFFPSLTTIDLSGATISKGAFDGLLNKCDRLTEMNLTGASFDPKEFMSLAQQHQQIMFKMEPTDATVEIISYLTNNDRLIRRQSPWMMMNSSRQLRGYDIAGRPVYTEIKLVSDAFKIPELDLDRYRMSHQRQLAAGSRYQAGPMTPMVIEPEMTDDDSNSVLGRALGLFLGGQSTPDKTSAEQAAETTSTQPTTELIDDLGAEDE